MIVLRENPAVRLLDGLFVFLIDQLLFLPVFRRLRCLGGGTEGGDLDDFAVEENMNNAETAADDPGIPEEPLDFLRSRVGADIEILGRPAEQEIPDPSPDEIGQVPGPVETVENLDGGSIFELVLDPSRHSSGIAAFQRPGISTRPPRGSS